MRLLDPAPDEQKTEVRQHPGQPQHSRSSPPAGVHIRCPHCHGVISVDGLRYSPLDSTLERPAWTCALGGTGPAFREVVHSFRRALIAEALWESDGVKADAAKLLGVSPSTLWDVMHRLGMHEGLSRLLGRGPFMGGRLEARSSLPIKVYDAQGTWGFDLEIGDRRHLLTTATRAMEEALATRLLRLAKGNVAGAARLGGLKYTTFHALLRRIGERRGPREL